MKAAWFHCYAGIAGDMALGSLIDAGADVEVVRQGLSTLGVPGLDVTASRVQRAGLAATSIGVVTGSDEAHTEPAEVSNDEGRSRSGQDRSRTNDGGSRTFADITSLLQKADFPERAKQRALAVFSALATAEASCHDIEVADVHFHEVGGHDALADIVGTCLALEDLGCDVVHASPVALGRGTVRTAHGTLPHPAPATLRLLEGIPVTGTDLEVELTTPTGAALLVGLGTVFGPLPPMTVQTTGYGAGRADFAHMPNCVSVTVGAVQEEDVWGDPERGSSQMLDIVEAHVDDVTGELLGHAVGRILEAGALDAWVTPSTGKKGRPSHTVSALCEPGLAAMVAQVLVEETGSLGARRWSVSRWAMARHTEEVNVDGLRVRFKVSGQSAKPEYDDIALLARREGVALPVARRLAMEEWYRERR